MRIAGGEASVADDKHRSEVGVAEADAVVDVKDTVKDAEVEELQMLTLPNEPDLEHEEGRGTGEEDESIEQNTTEVEVIAFVNAVNADHRTQADAGTQTPKQNSEQTHLLPNYHFPCPSQSH